MKWLVLLLVLTTPLMDRLDNLNESYTLDEVVYLVAMWGHNVTKDGYVYDENLDLREWHESRLQHEPA